MLEIAKQYRVLGAMAALGNFTVPELGRFSEVSERTVRSVLERNADLYESLGKEATGRRGGSYIRYRMTNGGDESVRDLLRQMESTAVIVGTGDISDALPDELIAAEHAVLTEIPAADSQDERERLLAIVCNSLESMQHDAQSKPVPTSFAGRLRVLSFLVRLTERELGLRDAAEPSAVAELLDELVKIGLSYPPVDSDLVAEVQRRLQESPLSPARRSSAGMVLVSGSDGSAAEIVEILSTDMADEPLELASPANARKLASAPFSRRHLYLFPLSVLAAPRKRWNDALATMRTVGQAGNDVIALDDHWNKELAGEVLENQAGATYLPVHDLPRRSLVATIRQHLSRP